MDEQVESESDNLKQGWSGFPRKACGEVTLESTEGSIADESGIGSELSDSIMDHTKADLEMSHATNHTSLDGSKLDMDVSHSANHASVDEAKLDIDVSQSNNHTSVEELITPDKNKSENSFSVSVIKKDDSGIYSEKSPDGTSITKENSDASLSESISESLDENLLLSTVTPMETDTLEVDVNVSKNSCSPNADNSVITVAKTSEEIIGDEVLGTKAKCTDESVSNDTVSVDDNDANKNVDNSISNDGKTVMDHAIDNSAKLTDETKEKDLAAGDKVIETDTADKSGKEEHSKSEVCEENKEVKDLKPYNEEQGALTPDSDLNTSKKQNSESLTKADSIMDNDTVENKNECDNPDEAASSEQAAKSQTESNKPVEKRRTRRYVFHDGSSSSSSSSHSEEEVRTIRRRRRRNRLLDSDSDIDSDEDLAGDKKSSSESEDGVEESVPLTQYGPPKQKWRAMYDVRERELGYSYKKYENYFQQKVQGSLRMVQRFDLQYKMDHHEGCVNALHFNRKGKTEILIQSLTSCTIAPVKRVCQVNIFFISP